MADLPGAVTYGTISGRMVYADLDTADPLDRPDMVPAEGKVFITPDLKSPAAIPSALLLVMPRKIELNLVDGYLENPAVPGQRQIVLVASDNALILPQGWTYTMSFDLVGAPGPIPAFSFQVLGGSNVDLSSIFPTPSNTGFGLTQAEAAIAQLTSTFGSTTSAAASAALAATYATRFLTGTGSPLGVVSAIPGTKYVDTAGTSGAWEWIKQSGSSSTGWVVSNGDTGWRDVRTWLEPTLEVGVGATAVARFLIRRINNKVRIAARIKISATPPPSGHLVAFKVASLAVGSGMRVDTVESYEVLGTGYANSVSFGTLVNTNTPNDIAFGGHVGVLGNWTTGEIIVFTGEWLTADPWPTTLPGSPA